MAIPEPLHPLAVHFPLVLAVFAPPLALLALWAIRSGRIAGRAWLGVVVLQALLAGSAWLAMETGEHEEERVEKVVAEGFIEEHEEAAERFLLLAALGLPVAAAGLLRGPLGGAARGLTAGLALAALVAGTVTGHSGGELVYRHGAAQAYAGPAGSSPAGAPLRPDHEEEDD